MTDVRFAFSPERYRMSLRGHAGYNPGNDIVCAGVSSIVFSLLGWLANASEHITATREMRYEPGRVDVDVSGDKTLQTAFDMALIGISQIEQSYPANVHVNIFSEP